MKQTLLTLGLAVLAALTTTNEAEAQCFGPDKLDSAPCCTPVTPNLPALMPFSMDASGFCWDACTTVTQNCVRIAAGTPLPQPQCGQYIAPLEVIECTGTPLLKGELVLDYTRTWVEKIQPGSPGDYQVWRFAAKVDMLGDYTTTPQCPVPPSLIPSGTGTILPAFFYGYYDLALNCNTGAFEHALVLFHGCDAFQHKPSLSSNPGVFNPVTSYAIVGPDTPLNPFIPAVFPIPGGPVFSEAIRSTAPTFAGQCRAEEGIVQGALSPLGSACFCPLSFTSPQQTASKLDVVGACGGGASSINAFPIAPWVEFVMTSLGQWGGATSYPGPERAAVGEGLFVYRDVCSSTGAAQQSLDVFYGGVTMGGFIVPPLSPIGGPPTGFIDIASNYSSPLPGPVALPLVGDVGPTDHLIYANF